MHLMYMYKSVYVCMYVCVDVYIYKYILHARAVGEEIREACECSKKLVIFWHNRIVYYHTDACTASVFHEKKK